MFSVWAITATLALAHFDSGAASRAQETVAAEPGSAPVAEPASPSAAAEASAAPARPAWIEAGPQTVDGVYYETVDSGPFATAGEAQEKLDNELVSRVHNHVDEYLNQPGAARYFDFSPERIRTELVPAHDTFTETRPYSFGTMQHAYARLAISSSFHDELRRQWRDVQSWFRLARFGLFGLLGTAALATLFTWLRLDTFTRGLHTFGLRLTAAATILALVALGYFAALRIPAL